MKVTVNTYNLDNSSNAYKVTEVPCSYNKALINRELKSTDSTSSHKNFLEQN